MFLIVYGSGLRNASHLTAELGGVSAEVTYFGPQGQFAGLDQINLRIPRELAGRGTVEIAITADGRQANRLTFETR